MCPKKDTIIFMKTLTKTDFIRARIEPDVKKESEKILKEIGLNMSDAIGVFFASNKFTQRTSFFC